MIKWRKKGLIFSPAAQGGWMNSHAQVPTPVLVDGVLRVYFSSRPKPNISLTTFMDLNPDKPEEIIHLNKQPILKLGEAGSFDEHGIMPSCVVENEGCLFLYYSGWSRCDSVPYHNTTGLAVSEDGGRTFKKIGRGPILDRTKDEPFSATSPFVLKEGSNWHMLYASGLKWVKINGAWEHVYTIKYASSFDGISWERKNLTAIEQADPLECTVRPSVIKIGGTYHMWFCYRGSLDFRGGVDSYRFGYARSENLLEWRREDDQAGIIPSSNGPDSEMVAYPYVLEIKGEYALFYNGNGFGKDGILLAFSQG